MREANDQEQRQRQQSQQHASVLTGDLRQQQRFPPHFDTEDPLLQGMMAVGNGSSSDAAAKADLLRLLEQERRIRSTSRAQGPLHRDPPMRPMEHYLTIANNGAFKIPVHLEL